MITYCSNWCCSEETPTKLQHENTHLSWSPHGTAPRNLTFQIPEFETPKTWEREKEGSSLIKHAMGEQNLPLCYAYLCLLLLFPSKVSSFIAGKHDLPNMGLLEREFFSRLSLYKMSDFMNSKKTMCFIYIGLLERNYLLCK